MPRFVILEHDHPTLHWDLMLEMADALRTWRLLTPPALGRDSAAELIFDHRKIYLEYEGPISGGRGQVRRWDQGTYEPALRADHSDETIIVEMRGTRVCGVATLALGEGGWSFRLVTDAS